MSVREIIILDEDDVWVDDSFAIQYRRPEMVEDPENPGEMISNPVSKEEFFHSIIQNFISDVVIAAEVKNIEVSKQQIITETKERTATFIVKRIK